jgi:hypothetical protein
VTLAPYRSPFGRLQRVAGVDLRLGVLALPLTALIVLAASGRSVGGTTIAPVQIAGATVAIGLVALIHAGAMRHAFALLLALASVAGLVSSQLGFQGMPTLVFLLTALIGVRLLLTDGGLVSGAANVLLAGLALAAVVASLAPTRPATQPFLLGLVTFVAPLSFVLLGGRDVSPVAVERVLWAVAIIAGAGAALAIVPATTGAFLYAQGDLAVTAAHGAARVIQSSSGGTIYSGGFIDAVAGAMVFATGALAALALAVEERAAGSRLLLIALFGLCVIGVLLTERRGVYIGFIAGLLVFLLLAIRRVAFSTAGVITLSMIAVMIAVILAGPLGRDAQHRIESLQSSNAQYSVQLRRGWYGQTLQNLRDRPAGTGPGAAVEGARFGDTRFTLYDTFYGVVGTEYGLLGLLCVVALLVFAAGTAVRRSQAGPAPGRLLNAGLAGCVVLFIVTNVSCAASYSLGGSFVTWMIVGLSIGRATATVPTTSHEVPEASR